MASIRYRNNKWQAQVIRKGHAPVARSFLTKQDAELPTEIIEMSIDDYNGFLTLRRKLMATKIKEYYLSL